MISTSIYVILVAKVYHNFSNLIALHNFIILFIFFRETQRKREKRLFKRDVFVLVRRNVRFRPNNP